MANGFSQSSEFAPFPEEFAKEVAKPETGAGLDAFAADIQAAEVSQLGLEARRARQFAPDQWAKAQQISGGLPLDVVLRNLPEVERQSTLDRYRSIFEQNERLRRNFAERPEDLQFVTPDELDEVSGIDWLGQALGQSFNAGRAQVELAQIRMKQLEGTATPEELFRADAISGGGERTYGIRDGGVGGWLQSGMVGLSQMIPQMYSVLRSGAAYGAGSAAAGGVLGSAAPGIGTVAGASAGLTLGTTYGAFEESRRQATGLAYDEFMKFRDETGAPLDPQTARFAAIVSGSTGAVLEQYGLTKVLGNVPGVGTLIRGLGREGMETALRNPTVRQAFGRFAAGFAEAGVVEISTEVLQEAIQILSGEIAKDVSGQSFEELEAGEITERLTDTAIQTAQVMTILGTVGPGGQLGSDFRRARRSKIENDTLQSQAEQVGQMPILQRSPETAARLIDSLGDGAEVAIPAAGLIRLFQTEGQDPYAVNLPNWRDRLAEAVASGQDVTLTKGEFFAHLAKDPKDNPLMDLVRSSPDAFNREEIKKFGEQYDEAILGITQQQEVGPDGTVAPKPEVALGGVAQDIQAQIEALGMDSSKAADYATLYQAFFDTMAKRSGVSTEELFAQYRPQFERGQTLMSEDPAVRRQGELTGMVAPSKSEAIPGDVFSQPVIKLFESADLSTPLHESGHLFLRITKDLSRLSPEIDADWQTIQRRFYAPEDGSIPRVMDEAFAKEFEAYLLQGKAPVPELRGIFDRFKQWLTFIYRSVKGLGGAVSPEMSEVFDRMLAAEDRLREVAAEPQYRSIFQNATELGIDPQAFLEYNKAIDESRAQAQDRMRGRVVGQQRKLVSGWSGQIAGGLRVEFREKLLGLPPYSHMEKMKGPEGIKINRQEFVARYGKEAEAYMPKGALRSEGFPVDVVSELFEYPSADDMVYDFRQAPPLRDAVNEAVRQEMYSRFGDDLADSEILDAAVSRAMFNNARETVLGTELRIINQKAGRADDTAQAQARAKEIARQSVRGKSVARLLKDEPKARAAFERTSRAVEAAMAKANWTEAARLQRLRLVQHEIMREGTKVSDTIEKIRAKAMRYTRKPSASVDPASMQQIRELVARFEFAKRSDKVLAKRESLRDYVRGMEESGQVPAVDEWLLDDARRVNYRELSVEELLGLGDALDNLEHMGRETQKLRVKGKKLAHEQAVAEVVQSIRQRPTKTVKMTSYSKREEGVGRMIAKFHADMLKPEQIMEWLDVGNLEGPMSAIFEEMAQAEAKEYDMLRQHAGAIIEVFKDIDRKELKQTVKIESMEAGPSGKGNIFTRDELFAIAANMGNQSNLDKLVVKSRDGGPNRRFSPEQLSEIVSHLSTEDMDRVQKIWDELERLWPKIAALEKRLTGVAPERVIAKPFVFKGKQYAGGYYPVVYDLDNPSWIDAKADEAEQAARPNEVKADELFKPALGLRPGTNHKYTVKRVRTEKPVALTLNILPNHLQTVIHDLTHREAVRNTYGILWDPRVRKAIIDVEGESVYHQLQEWLKTVANPGRHFSNLSTGGKFVGHLRANTVMFGLGFQITTTLAQGLGFFQTLGRVPPKYLGRGLVRWMQNPMLAHQQIEAMSGEMRGRFNQQDRDLKDNLSKFDLKDTRLKQVQRAGMWMIAQMDRLVSEISWMAAYEEQIQKAPDKPDLARQYADRIVRLTQGTGNTKDHAALMNDRGVMSLFTMFFSSFSAMYNETADLYRRTGRAIIDKESPDSLGKVLSQWAYLILIPAVVGPLVVGDTPEEDEDLWWWTARKTLLYPLAMVPGVRDIASSMDSGFDYTLSPLSRMGQELIKLQQRAASEDPDLFKLVKSVNTLVGLGLGLPLNAPFKQIENLWLGAENDDFKLTDILFGRQGR